MNKRLIFLNLLLFYNIVFCQKNEEKISQEELKSCEKESEIKENTFLLKTNLSESEIEKLLSQDFSSSPNNRRNRPNKRRKNDINVKQFKSKNDLNKTIYLLEINNISEYSNDINQNINKEAAPYELIDIRNNNETKIFLGFDKFFKSQYKEMFDYSYTIIIAFFVFIGMLIYYAFLLPNEAVGMSRNMGTRDNVNEGNINNENDSSYNDYELKE